MPEFAVIDFETANEKWESACAIGVAIVEGDCVIHSDSFLIRPHEMRFSAWNVNIHGITPDAVRDAPTLVDVWPLVWRLIEGKLVVAHSAKFDVGVLRRSLYANGMAFPEFDYICSCALSKAVWPELVSHSLGIIAPLFEIELDHHEAESDARAAAELVLKACRDTGEQCPRILSERLGLRIGHVFPDGNWAPCSSTAGRASRSRDNWLELELPADFDVTTHPLHQKSIVITGELAYCTRDNAHQLIEQLGGLPKSSVSKKTSLLVAGIQDVNKLAKGETTSNKMQNAVSLRDNGAAIEIVTAEDFFAMLFGNG